MDKNVRIRKSVSDLGVAAYVKMHGFKCLGRKTRNFHFEMDEKQSNEFDQLTIDYSNSPMHDFDSCIMLLKKLPEFLSDDNGKMRKAVSDLGVAAYVRMHGFKCVGRKARNFYFEMVDTQGNEFDQLTIDYSNSPMCDFDSCIMSLKKLPEYLSSN